MKIITVTANASETGKTTLITKTIKKLTSVANKIGVIKYSIIDNVLEPIVTNDCDIINTSGTDTARFKEAGSSNIVFIKSNKERLQQALIKAKNKLDDVNYLFIEGNSAVNYLQSDLIIYINNKEFKDKLSAEKARDKADIIINSRDVINKKEVSDIPFKYNIDIIKCQKALLIAEIMGIKPILIGKSLNRQKVKLTGCQLGCF